MKFLAVLLTLFTFNAFAVCIVNYPSSCNLQGSEYSSGGGKKIIVYIEIDCKDSEGNHVKYIGTKGSVGGLFGFGRFTMPEKIKFIRWSKDKVAFGSGC